MSPVALPESVRERIVELRLEGVSAPVIARQLGVSRSVVFKHSPLMPKKPKPPARPSRKGRQPGRKFYDDPRFDHPPEDEYDDVVPIPFFPDDLPRLGRDPFWTPPRLQWATAAARKILPYSYSYP